MTQYDQENDLGRGGGEVDDETMKKAWANAEEASGERGTDDLGEKGPGPWAKASSGDADEA